MLELSRNKPVEKKIDRDVRSEINYASSGRWMNRMEFFGLTSLNFMLLEGTVGFMFNVLPKKRYFQIASYRQ